MSRLSPTFSIKAARQCLSAAEGATFALLPSFFGGLIGSGMADSLGATGDAVSAAGIFGAVAAGTATAYALAQAAAPVVSARTAAIAAAASSAALGVASYIR